ncbi:thermonuclease family protein [Virgibacillus sp. Bac330]|uniref:thermonuclease family protein n=1 Tax=Virgibacillus sp. Bac330 TaxID=2419841 RepID=UPI000EF48892|nr:thermonuclease family protein [Virgibacillus sp. Bac330]
MRHLIKVIATIVVLIFSFFFFDGDELLVDIKHYFTEQELQAEEVVVKRVVDGDTIVIQNAKGEEERVRFLLLDTPESVHPRKPVQPFGKEASNFVKEQLEGETVQIELGDPETDKYGRLLAYIWVDDVNFNQLLIEKGYARVAYVYEPNTKYLDAFREAEQEAKEQEINIWSVKDYVTEEGFDMSVVR